MYSHISFYFLSWASFLVFTVIVVFYFMMIKKKIAGNGIQLQREVFYSSSSFLYLGLYFIFVSATSKLLSVFNIDLNPFISVLAAITLFIGLFVIILSKSVKNRFKEFVDRNIYKNKIDYRQVWHEFSESVASIVEIDEFINEISKTITKILKASWLEIFLQEKNNSKFTSSDGAHKFRIEIDPAEQEWLIRYGRTISSEIPEMKEHLYHLRRSLFSVFGDKANLYISPLINKRNFIGLLVCEFREKKVLNQEFLDLLNTLATESAIAIGSLLSNQAAAEAKEAESFYRLSTFIIHDLKNLISLLNLIVVNAAENIGNVEFQKEALNTLKNSTSKMEALINKLRFSSDEQKLKLKPESVTGIINDVLKDLKIDEQIRVKFEKKTFDGNKIVLLDREKIYSVIFNLVLNGIEAMPSGGKLKLACLIENDSIKFEVEDSGKGMSREFINNKLFRPFNTTKKNGLGIGLFQSKAIVEACHGKIFVESKLNQGTKFKVLIPYKPVLIQVLDSNYQAVQI